MSSVAASAAIYPARSPACPFSITSAPPKSSSLSVCASSSRWVSEYHELEQVARRLGLSSRNEAPAAGPRPPASTKPARRRRRPAKDSRPEHAVLVPRVAAAGGDVVERGHTTRASCCWGLAGRGRLRRAGSGFGRSAPKRPFAPPHTTASPIRADMRGAGQAVSLTAGRTREPARASALRHPRVCGCPSPCEPCRSNRDRRRD